MNKIYEHIKSFWGNLKFWQKGVIFGLLLFSIYTLIVIITSWNPPHEYCGGPCVEFHYSSWREFSVYNKISSLGGLFFKIFNWKVSFLVNAIASALIVSFPIFGVGFKLASYVEKYYEKGFVIGSWLLVVPLILVLFYLSRTLSGSGEQTEALIIPILLMAIPIFGGVGSLIGHLYGVVKKQVIK